VSSLSLDRPGAVQADAPDDGVAAHFGDPLREQRLAVAGAGWVDRSNRDVIRVAGADRHSWLHDLTTQDLATMSAGTGAEALVLSPQGHVEHHLVLADDGDATWIDVDAGRGADLVAFLESMRFMLRVDIEPRPEMAVVTVVGPSAADTLASVDLPTGAADYAVRRAGNVITRRMPWPLAGAVDVLVPRDEAAALLARLDDAHVAPLGSWGFEALRIAAGRPRIGIDTDHRTLPNEVGWIETAVHLAKGCYRGQETVARVHNLGRPPRRLALLHFDGSAERLPAPGTEITLREPENDVVGGVGSVGRHFELGPIGLGLLRRATPVDAALFAGDVPASSEVIVDPDVGLHVRPELRART
jgi:tRNA-modifying protein YgfZ